MDFNHFLISLVTIVNEMSPYVLLGFLIAGLLHVFVPASAMARHLSGRGLKPVVKAAILGIPLPLCSCGVLPAAVSLRRQGASRGASTSFLIATPQTGVDSIAATYSLLGLPMAIIRPIAALVGAVAGGMAVDRSAGARDDGAAGAATAVNGNEFHGMSFFGKLGAALRYGMVDMVASVGRWLVAGLLVAALITVLVPDSLFTGLSEYPLLAMLAVLVAAIPMYICATGSIPVAMSLMMKGLSPGIAFVMLMAGPAANFASLIILGKSYGRKATAIYVASVAVTAIVFGLAIDLLLPPSWFAIAGAPAAGCHVEADIFATVCSVVLLALLALSPWLQRRFGHKHGAGACHCGAGCGCEDDCACETSNNKIAMNTMTFKVSGMACVHCRNRVADAVSKVCGVESADVDLGKATLTVSGDMDSDAVMEAVRVAGYEIEPVEPA